MLGSPHGFDAPLNMVGHPRGAPPAVATLQGTLGPTPKKMQKLVEKTWGVRTAAFRNFGYQCLRRKTYPENTQPAEWVVKGGRATEWFPEEQLGPQKVPVMMFPKKAK